MKFLVDAQLPIRLARFLQASGHDAIHTLDLPIIIILQIPKSTKFP